MSVDTAASQPDEYVAPVGQGLQRTTTPEQAVEAPSLSPDLLEELWSTAGGEACGLTSDELGAVVAAIGIKYNHGLPPGVEAGDSQRAAFLRSLHLDQLALAHACALGREPAWERFVAHYRGALVQAATAITGSAGLGAELADSLYGELYGLRQVGGARSSPLASYSGRGSLLGWLRATLVQRYRDHLRRTRREEPLDDVDGPARETPDPVPAELNILGEAVECTLGGLPAEDRFLLAAYYLDRQTLLELARTLQVHEATISRRLKRLVREVRKQLLRNLAARGLSNAAAEEALGADPRDLEINLRRLLQKSQTPAFPNQEDVTQLPRSDPR